MTPPDEHETPTASAAARDALDAATAQLRDQPAALPVQVADRVLERALAAPRMADLCRARPPHDHLRVSTVALTALLRHRLDSRLEHAAMRRVVFETSREEQLESLTLELIVQYGHDIRATAREARALVDAVLAETVGELPASAVTVQHVHVSDVTVGDPHLVDPRDED